MNCQFYWYISEDILRLFLRKLLITVEKRKEKDVQDGTWTWANIATNWHLCQWTVWKSNLVKEWLWHTGRELNSWVVLMSAGGFWRVTATWEHYIIIIIYRMNIITVCTFYLLHVYSNVMHIRYWPKVHDSLITVCGEGICTKFRRNLGRSWIFLVDLTWNYPYTVNTIWFEALNEI